MPFNQCLGARSDPLSFTSLEDLRNGQSQYLSTIKQLVDALPKTEDPSSCYALRGHIARPGHKRLRHSMRAAIWWLLPSDGVFRHASHSLRYYLTRQGRHVVLRGGAVTRPPLERHLNWVPDPVLPPARCPGDLAAPSPSEKAPPQDASSKLPRRLRPRRRRERQPGLSAIPQEVNIQSEFGSPSLQCSDPAEVSGQSEFAASKTAAWNHENPSGASPDLLAPTASQIVGHSEFRTPI